MSKLHKRSLIELMLANNINDFKALLVKGGKKAIMKRTKKSNQTALHVACAEGFLTYTTMLLDFEADMNCADSHGYTPLHAACARGQFDTVEKLIERGVNVMVLTNDGLSALHIIALAPALGEHARVYHRCVDGLLQKGLKLDLPNPAGMTPLHLACINGSRVNVQSLLTHGANISAKNRFDESPLYFACQAEKRDVVQILLERGVSPQDIQKCLTSKKISAEMKEYLTSLSRPRSDPLCGSDDSQPVLASNSSGNLSDNSSNTVNAMLSPRNTSSGSSSSVASSATLTSHTISPRPVSSMAPLAPNRDSAQSCPAAAGGTSRSAPPVASFSRPPSQLVTSPPVLSNSSSSSAATASLPPTPAKFTGIAPPPPLVVKLPLQNMPKTPPPSDPPSPTFQTASATTTPTDSPARARTASHRENWRVSSGANAQRVAPAAQPTPFDDPKEEASKIGWDSFLQQTADVPHPATASPATTKSNTSSPTKPSHTRNKSGSGRDMTASSQSNPEKVSPRPVSALVNPTVLKQLPSWNDKEAGKNSPTLSHKAHTMQSASKRDPMKALQRESTVGRDSPSRGRETPADSKANLIASITDDPTFQGAIAHTCMLLDNLIVETSRLKLGVKLSEEILKESITSDELETKAEAMASSAATLLATLSETTSLLPGQFRKLNQLHSKVHSVCTDLFGQIRQLSESLRNELKTIEAKIRANPSLLRLVQGAPPSLVTGDGKEREKEKRKKRRKRRKKTSDEVSEKSKTDAKNEKNKLTLESWTKLTHQIQAVAALTDTIEQSLGFVDRLKGQEDFLSGEIVALQSELNDLQKRLADTQERHQKLQQRAQDLSNQSVTAANMLSALVQINELLPTKKYLDEKGALAKAADPPLDSYRAAAAAATRDGSLKPPCQELYRVKPLAAISSAAAASLAASASSTSASGTISISASQQVTSLQSSEKEPASPGSGRQPRSISGFDEDDTDDIKYLRKPNETIVKAATIGKLIEKLASEKNPDTAYLKAFLLTYRYFLAPMELLQRLIFRYCISPASSVVTPNASLQMLQIKESTQVPVRLRVLNVLRSWLDHHFVDFKNDPELVQVLFDFLDNTVSLTGNLKWVANFRTAFEKRMAGADPPGIVKPKPYEIVADGKKYSSLLDFEPAEAARQFTLIASELYRNILPMELVGVSWTKKDKSSRTPNIVAVTKNFNRVANVCISEILRREDLSQRKSALRRLIQIAIECQRLNNFDTATSIGSALQNSSIHRLRKTWEALDEDTLEESKNIADLISNHYAKLREKVRSASPPCVPYLGMYLTDLNFSEEIPNSAEGGLINFQKFHSIAMHIREIQQNQTDEYPFKASKEFRELLGNHDEKDDVTFYTISQRLEAPQPDKEKRRNKNE